MFSRVAVVVILILVVAGGSLPTHALDPSAPLAQQGGGDGTPMGGDDGGDGRRTPHGGDGQRTPTDDGRRTPGGDGRGTPTGDGPHANVSVDHHRPGNASIMVRNSAANRTVRIQFARMVANPDTGLMLREMTIAAVDPEYRLAVRTTTHTSEDVAPFPGDPPFGYLNMTHSVTNANVTNASLTFALNRTRLRERNVTAENVSLYRYRATNRTWQRLQTRVMEQNRTQVTYRAESPGLSEFAVAPTTAAATTPTATVTPTPTATRAPTPTATPTSRPSTPTPTPVTDGAAPGFGFLVAILALFELVNLLRSR